MRWRQAVACTLAMLLAGAGCKRGESVPTFETTTVRRGDISRNVTATGQLGAVVSVDVGSQISGKILALHADFNSPVKKGELVAEIDPSIYQAVVDQGKGELASAKAALELARLTSDRKRELVARKAGTQADLDKAQAEYQQAAATVTIQQGLLDRANADLDHCRIDAPVDGIVIARKVDVGQTVAATMTTPVLFTIAQDITRMHIIANVSEADIGQTLPGQPVDFTVEAFPDEVFHGVVAQVRKAPTTTENVVTYDTVIGVDNPEQRLFPGMTAEVSIRVADRHGVPLVSNAAIRFTPPVGIKFEGKAPPSITRGQRLVYLPGKQAGTLIARVAKVGITNGIDSEVIAGLKEADRVVTAANSASKRGPFGGPD